MPVINIEENLFVCPFTPRAGPTERPRVPEAGAEPGHLPRPRAGPVRVISLPVRARSGGV